MVPGDPAGRHPGLTLRVHIGLGIVEPILLITHLWLERRTRPDFFSLGGQPKAALRSENASYASPPATPESESHDSR